MGTIWSVLPLPKPPPPRNLPCRTRPRLPPAPALALLPPARQSTACRSQPRLAVAAAEGAKKKAEKAKKQNEELFKKTARQDAPLVASSNRYLTPARPLPAR
ncbi:hypothetical protein PG988_015984 [Apiospora saccharicola]